MGDGNPPALLDLVSSFLGPPGATTDASTLTPSSPTTSAHDTAPEGTTTPMPRHATVIVFSKDRPWQLHQLLRSMKLFCPVIHRSSSSEDEPASQLTIDAKVIARIDNFFAEGYQTVEDEFAGMNDHGQVTFLREDTDTTGSSDESTFERLLEKVINEDAPPNQDDNSLLMFLTDDCLLLEPIDAIISCAASCLSSTPRALAFLSRLHPAISWCQTRNVPCPPPRDEMLYVAHRNSSANTDMGAYVFNRKVGLADWSYPLDLSGGAYRRSDVVAILDWIRENSQDNKKLSYSHPNRLEIGGNMAISEAERETNAIEHATTNCCTM